MASACRAIVVTNSGSGTVLGLRAREVAVVLKTSSLFFRSGSRWHSFLLATRAIVTDRPSVLYAIDISVFTVGVAILALGLGARVIFDTGDDIPAIRGKANVLPRFNRCIGSLLERIALLCSSLVVARSDGLQRYIAAKTRQHVVVIPDGFDQRSVSCADRLSARRRWGVDDQMITVGVLGSANWNARLKWCYGREIIEALSRITRPDVVGVLLVRGDGLAHLESMARERGLSHRIIFETPIEGPGVYEQLFGLDVGVSTQTNDRVGQARTTGKLVQYLAADVYVLASRVGDAEQILPLEHTIVYEGAWDAMFFDRLAHRIESLPQRHSLKTIGHSVTQQVAPRFDYVTLRAKWQQAFAELTPQDN
jgi:glycosyltransferase involved in cell wall biosynthesis